MLIDFSQLSGNQAYHAMIQTIIPRPIAWVLTDNGLGGEDENAYNLAPFSYFAPVCSDPPLLMLSIGKKPNGELKDTLRNIIERKQCVVHIASSEMVEAVSASSAGLPHGESEIKVLNLALEPFDTCQLPRLQQCSIAYACELFDSKEIGPLPQAIVFLKVLALYVADDLTVESAGRKAISAEKINPLARLGGDEYWINGSALRLKRPL